MDNFMNINYLHNFYVSRVTYLTTPRSAPGLEPVQDGYDNERGDQDDRAESDDIQVHRCCS